MKCAHAINRYLLAIVVDVSREITFMTLNMTHINFACVCLFVWLCVFSRQNIPQIFSLNS